MRALIFDSVFSNNTVFILDGLMSSDLQTARHLNEELKDLAYKTDTPYCSLIRISSRSELFLILDQIMKSVR